MSATSFESPRRAAVIGAGGRVGRAVTAALLREAWDVTAVVREPGRHDLPPHPRLRVAPGDARLPRRLAPVLGTVEAVVLAVTPFTAPPESFDGFDPDYYVAIVTGLAAHWRAPRRRLVAVGLAATLRLDSGGRVMDDPALFPPFLYPFAQAHARQADALGRTDLDWAILVPPSGFGAGAEPAGRGTSLVPEPVTRSQATAHLSHGEYAGAVVAELAAPTVHGGRAAVVPLPGNARSGSAA
jgi:putative NADH-flavin reductase